MKFLCTTFISLFFFYSQAQQIKGVVVSIESGQPIQAASVYISNSSKGTVTAQDGSFTLINIPLGNITLVVNSIGYETFSKNIDVQTNGNYQIKIELKQKISELQEVKVFAWEKDGYKKWGQFFTENFIGKMDEATSCTIKNPEVLRFKHDKKNNVLIAKATETLLIENKALGYKINYDLEGFEYNFRNGVLFYYGYQFFSEMETKRSGKQKRWDKKRNEVYQGSMMHFMRALYKNQLEEEGFDAKFIVKTFNYEKQRVRNMFNTKSILNNGVISINTPESSFKNKDSSDYYNKVLNQPNEFNYLINKSVKADSITKYIDANTVELSFKDYLQVVYKYKIEPEKYLQQNWLSNKNKAPSLVTSSINLLGTKKINVFEKGQYYNPTEVLSNGWWAWSEKIAYLLPLDFIPSAK